MSKSLKTKIFFVVQRAYIIRSGLGFFVWHQVLDQVSCKVCDKVDGDYVFDKILESLL